MKSILLKNVNIIDGNLNSEVKANYDILIIDGKINKIDKNISFKANKIIDLSNKYIMPGLINLHAHMPAGGKLTKKKVANQTKLVSLISSNSLMKAIGTKICAKYAKEELYSGVTSVRAVGGVANIDSLLRDKINNGKIAGPRIISSNNAICTADGHMEGTVSVVATDSFEATALVDKQIRDGADIIKIMITGGILDTVERGKPGVLKMEASMVKTICDYAHQNGKIVAAHVEGVEGMEIAIENGVDTIEHGALVSDELLLKLKERKGAVVCTISPAVPLAELDPSETGYGEAVQYNTKVFMESMLKNARRCMEIGIRVGLGNDVGCPYVTHYGFYRELIYTTKYLGCSNSEAIWLATFNNADILGIPDLIGTIEENKLAEMVVLNENPYDDLNTLANPYMVLKDNKVYKKKIKKYKDVEQALNKIM